MLKRIGFAGLALALAATMASAGGGKVKWADCKSDKDFDRIAAEAKQFGQIIAIYFSSDS